MLVCNRTLHIGQVTDGLESSEQQRMVAHYEITSLSHRLVNHLFSDV